MQQTLVDQAKQGDEEAFDALARLVGDRCMAIACRILRDDYLAEDAVQSALVVAWRELRTLRDPDRFEPWLHRILTNECYGRVLLAARAAPGPWNSIPAACSTERVLQARDPAVLRGTTGSPRLFLTGGTRL